MRFSSWALVVLFLLPAISAAGQANSGVQLFAGYSAEEVSTCGTAGDTFLTCSGFMETGYSSAASYNGWNAAFTVFLPKLIGLTADFAGHYGSTIIRQASASTSRYSFMGGPTAAFSIRGYTPFAHALFGGVYNHFGAFSYPGGSSTVPNYTKFSWMIGGGLDIGIWRRFAIRVGEFDYERVNVPAAYGSYPAIGGFRFSTGVVFRSVSGPAHP